MNLDGIKAKLNRAKQSIASIEDGECGLRDEVLPNILREVHEDVAEQHWVYRGGNPTVPADWSAIIGEVFYNLRSALDQLLWQLVLDNGETPGRHNTFPITLDSDHWQSAIQSQLRDVHEKHIEAIGRLQPFTGGPWFPFNVRMLKAVNELNIIDKHRHLVMAVMAASGIDHMVFGENQPLLPESPDRPPLSGELKLTEVKEGRTLLVFNNPDTELRPSFHIDLRFTEEESYWTVAKSVPQFLRECLKTVEGSVDFLTRHAT